MQKIIYKMDNGKYNPLKDIKVSKLDGWEIGNFQILFKEKSNRLRNIVCDELGIKHLVFGQNHKKK